MGHAYAREETSVRLVFIQNKHLVTLCHIQSRRKYFLPRLRDGRLKNILYAATGALLSPMLCQQGESIPGICHLIHLSHFPGKGRF